MSGSSNSVSVAVFGLGYVGAVSAACLARDGHTVIGVDPNPLKVAMINEGRSPVVEPGLTELVAEMVATGQLRATDDYSEAVAESDVALICVGTPSRDTGETDLSHLRAVARQIGHALSDRTTPYTVCVRSTSFPGTTEDEVIPAIEEEAGRPVGTDIGVCFNPEFLREGSALLDYTTPPRVVVGGSDPRAREVVAGLYRHLDAPEVLTDLRSAEMLKYLDNAWHALKVGFANEVGRLAKRLGMDSRPLMEAFTLDTKLNISDKYLRPGFSFGGSCLPKDLRALEYKSRHLDIDLPIVRSILPSNQVHTDWAFDLIQKSGARSVGVLGLSFKPETDDLRESPMVTIVERLIGKGYRVRIHDPVVRLSSLVGANREYLLNQIPHISGLMVDRMEDLVEDTEVLVLGTAHETFKDALALRRPGQLVIDFVRLIEDPRELENYVGICW